LGESTSLKKFTLNQSENFLWKVNAFKAGNRAYII